MIYIKDDTNVNAYQRALTELLKSAASNDGELLHEQPACIEVGMFIDEASVYLDLKKRTLAYEYDWKVTFGHVSSELITEEIRYWNEELFGNDRRFHEIVTYLKNNLLSKRAIVQFWKDEYKDLGNPAACLAAVFFRVDGEKVHIHTHARASNASFLFFMDLQVMRAFQNAVAQVIGKTAGDFIFFTDSLHAYKTEENALRGLTKKIGIEVWRG